MRGPPGGSGEGCGVVEEWRGEDGSAHLKTRGFCGAILLVGRESGEAEGQPSGRFGPSVASVAAEAVHEGEEGEQWARKAQYKIRSTPFFGAEGWVFR